MSFKKCSDCVKIVGKARVRLGVRQAVLPVMLAGPFWLSWPISACASLLPGSEHHTLLLLYGGKEGKSQRTKEAKVTRVLVVTGRLVLQR